MTQVLETPAQPISSTSPSYEITRESIKHAKDEGVINQLGADALDGINPELVQSVIEKSRSLR